jgi:hypothetical protein
MVSNNIELCCLCGEPTGKAGEDEDSLFSYDFNDIEVGPLCETCFDEMDAYAVYRNDVREIGSPEVPLKDAIEEAKENLDGENLNPHEI